MTTAEKADAIVCKVRNGDGVMGRACLPHARQRDIYWPQGLTGRQVDQISEVTAMLYEDFGYRQFSLDALTGAKDPDAMATRLAAFAEAVRVYLITQQPDGDFSLTNRLVRLALKVEQCPKTEGFDLPRRLAIADPDAGRVTIHAVKRDGTPGKCVLRSGILYRQAMGGIHNPERIDTGYTIRVGWGKGGSGEARRTAALLRKQGYGTVEVVKAGRPEPKGDEG